MNRKTYSKKVQACLKCTLTSRSRRWCLASRIAPKTGSYKIVIVHSRTTTLKTLREMVNVKVIQILNRWVASYLAYMMILLQ